MVATAYPIFILLAFSSTLKIAKAWYDRDDSPELYGYGDRDSSPEQGYGYGGSNGYTRYGGYNGYNGNGAINGYYGNGGYNGNGYGAYSDIDDVSLELSREQSRSMIQLQPQAPPPILPPTTAPPAVSCDGSIPASSFPNNYLCVNCNKAQDAETKMNWPGFVPVGAPPYLVFADKTSGGNPISYTDVTIGKDDKCTIRERVQVWSCKRSKTGRITCSPQGFCTVEINKDVSGDYKPNAVPTCTCVNPHFEDKHVCPGCRTDADALAFVLRGLKPTGGNTRDIFSGSPGPLTYRDDKVGRLDLCLVTNPAEEVMSWKCNPRGHGSWANCESIGYCTKLKSKLTDGHFEYADKACYKVHPNKIWEDRNCPTLHSSTVVPDTTGACMLKCRESYKADPLTGCNAFNFKQGAGAPCTLKRCPSPYPVPIANTDNYGAYYQDVII